MRSILFRLGGALLLFGLTANAGAPAFPEGSAVIVRADKLISSDPIDATEPGSVPGPITLYSYDAEFTVTSRLAGPDVGEHARISFIDQRDWRAEKLFMIVHRDGVGRLWARRSWQEVGSELCLSAQQVATLGLTQAFSSALDNSKGQRCIKV